MQKDRKRTGYFDVPRFGLLPTRALVDQENIGSDFESEADRFTLSDLRVQTLEFHPVAVLACAQAKREVRTPKPALLKAHRGVASLSGLHEEPRLGHKSRVVIGIKSSSARLMT